MSPTIVSSSFLMLLHQLLMHVLSCSFLRLWSCFSCRYLRRLTLHFPCLFFLQMTSSSLGCSNREESPFTLLSKRRKRQLLQMLMLLLQAHRMSTRNEGEMRRLDRKRRPGRAWKPRRRLVRRQALRRLRVRPRSRQRCCARYRLFGWCCCYCRCCC